MRYRVLVTGGSRGIGKTIADLYTKSGYDVATPSRKELDLEDCESVKMFVEKNMSFDIIINNAGNNDVMAIDNLEDRKSVV